MGQLRRKLVGTARSDDPVHPRSKQQFHRLQRLPPVETDHLQRHAVLLFRGFVHRGFHRGRKELVGQDIGQETDGPDAAAAERQRQFTGTVAMRLSDLPDPFGAFPGIAPYVFGRPGERPFRGLRGYPRQAGYFLDRDHAAI